MLIADHPKSRFFNKRYEMQRLRTIREFTQTREKFWRHYPMLPFQRLAFIERRIKAGKT